MSVSSNANRGGSSKYHRTLTSHNTCNSRQKIFSIHDISSNNNDNTLRPPPTPRHPKPVNITTNNNKRKRKRRDDEFAELEEGEIRNVEPENTPYRKRRKLNNISDINIDRNHDTKSVHNIWSGKLRRSSTDTHEPFDLSLYQIAGTDIWLKSVIPTDLKINGKSKFKDISSCLNEMIKLTKSKFTVILSVKCDVNQFENTKNWYQEIMDECKKSKIGFVIDLKQTKAKIKIILLPSFKSGYVHSHSDFNIDTVQKLWKCSLPKTDDLWAFLTVYTKETHEYKSLECIARLKESDHKNTKLSVSDTNSNETMGVTPGNCSVTDPGPPQSAPTNHPAKEQRIQIKQEEVEQRIPNNLPLKRKRHCQIITKMNDTEEKTNRNKMNDNNNKNADQSFNNKNSTHFDKDNDDITQRKQKQIIKMNAMHQTKSKRKLKLRLKRTNNNRNMDNNNDVDMKHNDNENNDDNDDDKTPLIEIDSDDDDECKKPKQIKRGFLRDYQLKHEIEAIDRNIKESIMAYKEEITASSSISSLRTMLMRIQNTLNKELTTFQEQKLEIYHQIKSNNDQQYELKRSQIEIEEREIHKIDIEDKDIDQTIKEYEEMIEDLRAKMERNKVLKMKKTEILNERKSTLNKIEKTCNEIKNKMEEIKKKMETNMMEVLNESVKNQWKEYESNYNEWSENDVIEWIKYIENEKFNDIAYDRVIKQIEMTEICGDKLSHLGNESVLKLIGLNALERGEFIKNVDRVINGNRLNAQKG